MTKTVSTPTDTDAWRDAYRIYSRWVKAGDRSARSVWAAIQEAAAVTPPDEPTPTDELTGYAVTAAELRRIADALDTLPPVDKPPYVSLSILPEHTAEAVDAVALAVIGEPGGTERIGGDWIHIARREGFSSAINLRIHAKVPGPADERDVELERLRAENAELRVRAMPMPQDPTPTQHMATMVDRTGLNFSREADDPEPGVVPNGVEGGPVTGRATVPDTSCLAVLPSGVRCDDPIYWNTAANAWWHRIAETIFDHTATGPSVPPVGGE